MLFVTKSLFPIKFEAQVIKMNKALKNNMQITNKFQNTNGRNQNKKFCLRFVQFSIFLLFIICLLDFSPKECYV